LKRYLTRRARRVRDGGTKKHTLPKTLAKPNKINKIPLKGKTNKLTMSSWEKISAK
jgi:hypothetical protein